MLCWGCFAWWLWVCVVERVNEAVSSEGPQWQGLTHTYRDSLERPHSVPMQPYLEVWYCVWSTHAWLGSKFFGAFTRIVVKVYNLCRVETYRLAVLTVKSGLEPHMIIELEDDLNRFFIYVGDDYLWYWWLLHMLILGINGINLLVDNACLIKLD